MCTAQYQSGCCVTRTARPLLTSVRLVPGCARTVTKPAACFVCQHRLVRTCRHTASTGASSMTTPAMTTCLPDSTSLLSILQNSSGRANMSDSRHKPPAPEKVEVFAPAAAAVGPAGLGCCLPAGVSLPATRAPQAECVAQSSQSNKALFSAAKRPSRKNLCEGPGPCVSCCKSYKPCGMCSRNLSARIVRALNCSAAHLKDLPAAVPRQSTQALPPAPAGLR